MSAKGLDPVKLAKVLETVPETWSYTHSFRKQTGLSKNVLSKYLLRLVRHGQVQRVRLQSGYMKWRRTPEGERPVELVAIA